MKILLSCTILAMVFAINSAAPQFFPYGTEILANELNTKPDGSYKFGYTLSDGTTRTKEATFSRNQYGNTTLTIRGTVSWIGPDGQTYTVEFVADENGYQPRGQHLPK